MDRRSSPPSKNGGGSDNAVLCLALFAILAIVIVSVIGFSNCATDNGDGTENEAVYFTEDSVRYVVLKDTLTEKTVGVVRNDYGSEVMIPDHVTDQQTGKQYTVVSIENDAFNGCDNLTKVTIPSTVTDISSTAFRNCKSLSLSNSEIKDNDTFKIENNTLLKKDNSGDAITWTVVKCAQKEGSLDLSQANVTAVGDYAFEGLGITDVKFDSVTEIGIYAFAGCTSLTEVKSDVSITKYGGAAFSGCVALTACDLTHVTAIPGEMFKDCASLKSITLPNSLESIGEAAFYGCTSLNEIKVEGATVPTVPSGVTELKDDVFRNCSALTTFHLHKGISSVSNTTFLGCTGMKEFTVENDNVGKFSAKSGVIYQDTDSGKCLFVFPGNSGHEFWDFKNGEKSIAPYAFSSCVNREISLWFASFKGTICDYAFAGSHVSKVEVGYTIQSIGAHAFENCTHLKSVEISIHVQDPILASIGDYAFAGCTSLKNFYNENEGCVNLPKTLTSLGENAFAGCTSVTKFVKCTSPSFKIVNNVLYNSDCTKLLQYPLGSKNTSFTVLKSTTQISPELFVGVKNLNTIYVEEGNQSFVSKDGVLYNTKMTTLVLYPAAKSANVEIPTGVTSIGDHAFDGSKVISVVFNDVQNIGSYAFRNCTNLTIDKIGSNVTSIGAYAFSSCTNAFGYGTLTLSDKVTSVGDRAFENCANIKKVDVKQTSLILFNNDTFKGCGDGFYLMVPYETFLDYRTYTGDFSAFYFINNFYTVAPVPEPADLTYNGEKQKVAVTDLFTIKDDEQIYAGGFVRSVEPILSSIDQS